MSDITEQTLRALPHLTREQVQDALGYYADHHAEIDAYITANAQAYDEGANATKSRPFAIGG